MIRDYIYILLFILFSFLASSQNMELGYAMLEEGRNEEAAIFFTDTLAVYPKNKTARICQARALGLSTDPVSALDKLKVLHSEDPSDYEVGLNLAEAYLWNKQHRNGLKQYFELIKTDKNNFVANLGAANALAGLNENTKALKVINRALQIDPGNPAAMTSKKYILIALAYKNAKQRKHKESYAFLDSVELIEANQYNAQQIRILLKDHRRIRGYSEYFMSEDNGKNIASGFNLYQSIGWTPKNRFSVDFSKRTTDNTLFPFEGKQTLAFLKNKTFISEKINIQAGIGLLQNETIENKTSNILTFARTEMILNKYNFLNLNYGTEYLNYNTDHVLKNLKSTYYKAEYHLYTPWRIGLFSLGNMNYISGGEGEGNSSRFLFLSLYYHIRDTPGIKTGVNYTQLHFDTQTLVYFSPNRYQALEGFFHIENLHRPTKIQYKALLASGLQKIEDNEDQRYSRLELQLGYRITKQLCLNATYMYSNSAQGILIGNYEFQRFGIRLDNTF